jgi:alpha-tubulin suppressor-like RCC1 family protein
MRALLLLSLLLASCGNSLVDHLGVTTAQTGCPTESVDACGAACAQCPAAPQNGTAECLSHACTYRCSAPYLKCDGGCCLASAVAAGGDSTCALVQGVVRCWGAQLGSNALTSPTPVQIGGLASVSALVVGPRHACAIISGSVRCWGDNEVGQLGQQTPAPSATPLDAVPGVSGATALALGDRHSCARTGSGVVCWGANDLGQLGDGTQQPRAGVSQVVGTSDASAIAAGLAHTCAALGGGVSCWGAGGSGQIGNGSMNAVEPNPAAVKFSGGSLAARTVAAGHNHSCALLSSSLACWGQAGFGQLGDGSTSDRDQARQVSLSNPSAIAAGRAHSCAVGGGAQDVWCWGANDKGELGTGDNVAHPLPFEILLSQVESLSSGADHVCARQSSGAILCWGHNDKGQTGSGSASASVLTPTAVSGR